MSRLLLSAAHKSSGKTTISIGLCAAFAAQGMVVQPFKKGPDYIDPMWLALASGHSCFNLDPFLMSADQITDSFVRHARQSDIALVEGNKGLYDGLALDGSNSNAALATLLDLPVVLVIDARGMTRGIAPLILGYQAFDPKIHIGGVILNRLGGSRHEAKLRAVIEYYTDVPVLGAVASDASLEVVERHLGLMPSHEAVDARHRVSTIGERIAQQVDLDRVVALAAAAPPLPERTLPEMILAQGKDTVRIAIAKDKAFGFYYPDDLLALQAAGAEIVYVNTLNDTVLPAVDGLFIGGGFPEMFMTELSANTSLRESIRTAIEADLPVYAECGGLMYLARQLSWGDQCHTMVGALPIDVQMNDRPVGRGYVELEPVADHPWQRDTERALTTVRGHEFHYSSVGDIPPSVKFAFRVKRGHGVDGQRDGLVYRNVLASYAHLRGGAGSNWPHAFVNFVRGCRDNQRTAVVNALPANQRVVCVKGKDIVTDAEGYLSNRADWSEDFVRAQAQAEYLPLDDRHWQVIRFLRDYFDEHQVQAQVRTMIKHFSALWPEQSQLNHYLHELFPVGGPQKQGNRLAGLLKTKGEH